MAIFSSSMGVIIDKCGVGAFFQKRYDGSIAAPADTGVVMNGAFVPALAALGFSGQASAYKYVLLDTLVAGGAYNISGRTAPVEAEVFLSISDGTQQEDLLYAMSEKTPVASAISNSEDGSFSFADVQYEGGIYFVWIKGVPDYTNITTMTISADAVRVSVLEGTPQAVHADIMSDYECSSCKGTGISACSVHTGTEFVRKVCPTCDGTGAVGDGTCPTCDGIGAICGACYSEGNAHSFDAQCANCSGVGRIPYKYWSGTISGQCPADTSMIYFSSGYNADRTLADLETSTLTSVVPATDSDGNAVNYSISTDVPTSAYTVWCISETPDVLTATLGGSYRNEETTVCLAGSTLITLADGTFKRLDELKVGEHLLSGSGEPTLAIKLGRGIWRPSHTLYYFDNGTVIDEISTHRFYNAEQGFWQKLECWNIGEHAKCQDGTFTKLVRVERIEEDAECFGLWTESKDYFANGLLSGDAGCNRPLLEDATLEQAMDMAVSLTELEVEQMFYGGVL